VILPLFKLLLTLAETIDLGRRIAPPTGY